MSDHKSFADMNETDLKKFLAESGGATIMADPLNQGGQGVVKPITQPKPKEPRSVASQTQSKYHNTPTVYQGVRYHSKREALKAQELDLLVKAGEIDFYLRQVSFDLPGGIKYVADFVTFMRVVGKAGNGETETFWTVKVIEVKAWRKETKKHKAGFFFTDASRIKMRQMAEIYKNLTISVER